MEPIILNEYRCQCGKLLCKGMLLISMLELKCRFCHRVNRFNGIDWLNMEGSNQYAILAAISTVDAQKDDPSPYIVDATDSTFSILGFTREELIGREVRSLDPLMASGAYGNLWKLIVERDFRPFAIEVYQPRKDGKFIKTRSRAVFQKTKETIYLLSIFDPIEILSCVPDRLPPFASSDIKKMFCPFVLELNQNGVCDTATYEVASLLGYLITDIVNEPFLNLYPKSIARDRRKSMFRMIKNRQSFCIRNDMLEGKGGARHIFDSYFTVRYTDSGIFAGFSVTLWPARI